jgi:CheY-like chemotaxis protein
MATILLVEDHEDTRYVLGRHLVAWGHRVLSAENGEAGMAILATDTPDLIIVDGMMPGMNGTEFIRLTRAQPATATIPIILYTAVSDRTFVEDAIAKGANEVWIKGDVTPGEIRQRLTQYLAKE